PVTLRGKESAFSAVAQLCCSLCLLRAFVLNLFNTTNTKEAQSSQGYHRPFAAAFFGAVLVGAAFFGAAFAAGALRTGLAFAGRPSRSAINSTASSSVIASGDLDF